MKENAQQTLASVVVITRNRAASLKRALLALQKQEYSNYEVIVVDNDSTDSTKSVVEEFGAVYAFTPSKSGIGSCRQKGVEVSRGQVIAFCDDDCAPSPQWLVHIVRRLMEDPKLGLVGGQVTNVGFPDHKQFKGRSALTKHGKCVFVADTSKAEFFGNMNLSFRRDVIQAVGGYDPFFNVYEEIDLALRIRKQGYKIAFEPLAETKHHYTGISHKRRQFFYGPELVRLYLCMKHLKPGSTKEWLTFLGFELRLLGKELVRFSRRFFFALRKGYFDRVGPLLIELFNKISARMAIPWLLHRAQSKENSTAPVPASHTCVSS